MVRLSPASNTAKSLASLQLQSVIALLANSQAWKDVFNTHKPEGDFQVTEESLQLLDCLSSLYADYAVTLEERFQVGSYHTDRARRKLVGLPPIAWSEMSVFLLYFGGLVFSKTITCEQFLLWLKHAIEFYNMPVTVWDEVGCWFALALQV